jgi:hypothetical protein
MLPTFGINWQLIYSNCNPTENDISQLTDSGHVLLGEVFGSSFLIRDVVVDVVAPVTNFIKLFSLSLTFWQNKL